VLRSQEHRAPRLVVDGRAVRNTLPVARDLAVDERGVSSPEPQATSSGSESPASRSKYSSSLTGFPAAAKSSWKIAQSRGSSSEIVPLKSNSTEITPGAV